MAKLIGVRFKHAGKLFYFDPGNLWPSAGDDVIVETARGAEFGQVIMGIREVDDSAILSPLKPVLRIADDADRAHVKENEAFNQKAAEICRQKIEEHGLNMKLVGVEVTFDNSKILFYFTADGRVDFRMLVKDLASHFHTRIELRQIGVRDEAKLLGGLGPCGRPICCGNFLGDFEPVTIRMAKEQNLSLNPTKISGVCGRLMCCLKFEEEQYEKARRRMPRVGRNITTPDGDGLIVDINVLKETVTVRLIKGDTAENKEYDLEQLNWHPRETTPAHEERSASEPQYASEEVEDMPLDTEEALDEMENQPVPEEVPARRRRLERRKERESFKRGKAAPARPGETPASFAPAKPSESAAPYPPTRLTETAGAFAPVQSATKEPVKVEKPTAPEPVKAEKPAANDWLKAVEDALNAAQK